MVHETAIAENLYEHRSKSDGKSEVHSVSVHKGIVNQIEHLGRSFSAANTSKYNLVKPFDIVYTKSPTGDFPYGVVKQNLTGQNVIVSPLYGVFKPTNEYVGNLIHAYFGDPGRTNNYLVSLVQKGAKNTLQISNDRFLLKGIYLPNNESEQKKIAHTLSSLDDLLTAQSAKLEALQVHKRGMMQGLFPAEGETVPKLRFLEFQDEMEWEEKTLGSIMVEGRLGSNFQSSEDDRGTPVIKMANLGRGRIYLDKVEYISEDFKYSEDDLLKAGDLLFNTRNSLELVGKVAIWNNELPTAVYNTNLLRISFDNKIVSSNYFMNYLFNTQGVLKKLRSVATGTTSVAAIYGKDLHKLVVSIPSSVEQQKIADCLSSLDDRITAQNQKIEALRLHKKGLMQGLFPELTTTES